MASPLKVVVTAETSGLSKGMAESARIAQSGAASITAALANVKRGAEDVSGAMAGFAREQRSQARVFGFYAQELGGIAGAAKGTQQAISGAAGVIADLATGSIVGAAIGALGMLAVAWRETGEAAAQAKQQSQKTLRDLADEAKKSALAIERMNYIAAGGDGRIFDARNKLRDGEATYQAMLARERELRASLARQEEGLRSMFSGRSDGATQERIDSSPMVQRYREKLAMVTAEIADVAAHRNIIMDEAFTESAQENAAKARKAGQATGEAYRKGIEDVLKANEKERTAYNLQQLGGYGADADAARRRDEERRSYGSSAIGQGAAGEAALLAMNSRTRTPDQQAESKRLNEAIARHKKDVSELQKGYEAMAETAGRGFADIITGNRKAGDVAKDLARQGLQLAAQYALKQITNAALKGGSEAAASSAEAGPPGVIAAPGVMAAFIAMVMGLAGSVVSAEGGADLIGMRGNLSRGGFLNINHPDEMTLDAGLSRWVRKAAQRDAEGLEGGGYGARLRVVGKNGSIFDMIVQGGRELQRTHTALIRRGLL